MSNPYSQSHQQFSQQTPNTENAYGSNRCYQPQPNTAQGTELDL